MDSWLGSVSAFISCDCSAMAVRSLFLGILLLCRLDGNLGDEVAIASDGINAQEIDPTTFEINVGTACTCNNR